MQDLTGKTAVVTGGASGIGRAVAERAAAAGMKIVLADIEERALDDTARSLSEAGADVLPVVTDVADGSSVEALRDRALAKFGHVDLVMNNAGVGSGGPAWSISEADWRWVLGVNLWGVIHGIRAFVPALLEQGHGHVVNTASVAGLVSTPNMAAYTATKHAVVAITETLSKDLRLAGSAVGCSVLCPGFVRTGIADSQRNRPIWAPPAADGPAKSVASGLVAAGIDPSIVADLVLDAVRNDRFYILTHPDYGAAVEIRMRDILEGRAPTMLQPAPV